MWTIQSRNKGYSVKMEIKRQNYHFSHKFQKARFFYFFAVFHHRSSTFVNVIDFWWTMASKRYRDVNETVTVTWKKWRIKFNFDFFYIEKSQSHGFDMTWLKSTKFWMFTAWRYHYRDRDRYLTVTLPLPHSYGLSLPLPTVTHPYPLLPTVSIIVSITITVTVTVTVTSSKSLPLPIPLLLPLP
jgi:hypothetical protein